MNKKEKNAAAEEQTGLPDYVMSIRQERKRPHFEDDNAVSPIWLITFTDVMALMLTFFVLLYSMAQPDVEKWQEITGAMTRQFNEYFAPEWQAGANDTISIDKISYRSALNLDYLSGLMKESLRGTEEAEKIVFLPQTDTLMISMPQDLLFESGRAVVSTEGQRLLFTLGGVLSRINNAIEIVGHSDPRPISGANDAFRSNWDLSLMRAVNVADVLRNVGYERKITVRGSAAGRYNDLPNTMDESIRQDLSRRVDIVVMKNDGSVREMFENFQK